MKPVDASELLSLGAYEEIRERFRARIIAKKKRRRVGLGEHMTLVFEDHDTVLFQIQEMLRAERITSTDEIAHELETYNSMVPAQDELFATLFIEYSDVEARHAALEALNDVEGKLWLTLNDAQYPARFERLPGEDGTRLPAVNYLRFALDGGAGAAMANEDLAARLEVEHPHYTAATALSDSTRQELARDLASRPSVP